MHVPQTLQGRRASEAHAKVHDAQSLWASASTNTACLRADLAYNLLYTHLWRMSHIKGRTILCTRACCLPQLSSIRIGLAGGRGAKSALQRRRVEGRRRARTGRARARGVRGCR
jgi:hypothetical protein